MEWFRQEVFAHRTLSRHPRIISILSAFKHGNKYNLILPKAQTNLELYISSSSADGPSTGLYDQIIGLAEGLNELHHTFAGHAPHNGNLKTRNILLIDGLFVLPPKPLEEKIRFAQSYDPPELRQSRMGDIWSLGCIFSEILTYMVRGPAGVKTFRDWRKTMHPPSPLVAKSIEFYPFYECKDASKEVLAWLAELRSEIMERPDTILLGLLDTIEQNMLVTAVDRINTDDLCRLLVAIKSSHNGPSWALTNVASLSSPITSEDGKACNLCLDGRKLTERIVHGASDSESTGPESSRLGWKNVQSAKKCRPKVMPGLEAAIHKIRYLKPRPCHKFYLVGNCPHTDIPEDCNFSHSYAMGNLEKQALRDSEILHNAAEKLDFQVQMYR